MTEIIYSRVSTSDQSTDAQTIELQRLFPSAIVVSEIASGAKARPMLDAVVAELKEGDALIVYALDRLSRRTVDILQLLDELERRKIRFVSIREAIDFKSVIGRMIVSVISSVGELERRLLSERTKLALAAAKAKGVKLGAPRRVTDRQLSRAISLVQKDGYTITKAAETCGMSFGYLSQVLRGKRLQEQLPSILDQQETTL